ncbi:2'-5' RNA ligase family protein [Isoptericola aurantiacus]|uniref:2'-5' RNA ligase family protein n=1 Tax=Isoptericola aurantiacus TaxID=3377839 RepID=UPI00383A85F9
MRLFTAVYPSPQALHHLDLALTGVGGPAVDDPGAGLRWVPAGQRHVTLSFHGEVPDGAVEGYVESLRREVGGLAPFDLSLAGSGSFGGRTLWVGLGGAVERLRSLAAAVDAAAQETGLGGADRAGGRAHLTVARASSSAARAERGRARRSRRRDPGAPPVPSRLEDWARALAVYRGPVWTVGAVRVVASELGAGRSGGPAHSEVAAVPLDGHID